MSYRIGYCRTSTKQQDLGMQRDALLAAGVLPEEIFEEQESGAKRDRPVLAQALGRLRKGDTFVCWKFDRVARSALHLLEIVEGLKARGVGFISITENFDISTPAGKMLLGMLAHVAEFERSMIEERRETGIARARAAGKKFGRKPKLTAEQLEEAADLLIPGTRSMGEVAERYGIHRTTLYRALVDAKLLPEPNCTDANSAHSSATGNRGDSPRRKGHLRVVA